MAELTADEKKIINRIAKAQSGSAAKLNPQEYQELFNLFCRTEIGTQNDPSKKMFGCYRYSNMYCKAGYEDVLKPLGEAVENLNSPPLELKEGTRYPLVCPTGMFPGPKLVYSKDCIRFFFVLFSYVNKDLETRKTGKQKDWPVVHLDFRSLCSELPYTSEVFFGSWKNSGGHYYCNGQNGNCEGSLKAGYTVKNLVGLNRSGNRASYIMSCPRCKYPAEVNPISEFLSKSVLRESFLGVLSNRANACIIMSTTYGGLNLSWGKGSTGRKTRIRVTTPSGSDMIDKNIWIDEGFRYLLAADMIGDAVEKGIPITVGPRP
jgi:hypothetical protein